MKKFVVVVQSEDFFTQCIAIEDKCDMAIFRAYNFVNECTSDNGCKEFTITPLYKLEGQTGVGFRFTTGEVTRTMYVLVYEEE